LSSQQPEYLLVEFLSELNYQVNVKKKVCIAVESIRIKPGEGIYNLESVLLLRNINDETDILKQEIKAITYHNIEIKFHNNVYTVVLVFDI
jgi:SHS2 domain-containing protein